VLALARVLCLEWTGYPASIELAILLRVLEISLVLGMEPRLVLVLMTESHLGLVKDPS
jgi:hypothetical protein